MKNEASSLSHRVRVSGYVDSEIKQQAEAVFEQVGISTSVGISLFLTQVALHHEIPFKIQGLNRKSDKRRSKGGEIHE